MNLDLIIKLAKLANENPNDNEANLAARKVCQLIKAAEYKFNVTTNPPHSKPLTYADVKRATEPAWSSRPPTGPGVDFDPFEFLRDYTKKRGYNRPFSEGSWGPEPFRPPPQQAPIFIEEFDSITRMYILSNGERITEVQFHNNPGKYKVRPGAERSDKSKPKQKLKCKDCGDVIETGYVGPKELFTCITCIWKSYQETKK